MRNIFKSIEEKTPTGLKILIGGIVVASVALVTLVLSSEDKDITAATVMITSLNERGGGTGVIIGTSESKSVILTNKHVCLITLSGGLVKTNNGGTYLVTGLSPYSSHDLCLITVAENLKHKAVIASKAPKMFTDATVSGHPGLLPNVVSKGHFSGKKVISVLSGSRDCSKEELENPESGIICAFFQGMPVINTSESVLVTATIMPGSSGSAVYNEDREISTLVFAGQGDLGYAFTVPFEYIQDFLAEKNKEFIKPNYEMALLDLANQKKTKELSTKCKAKDFSQLTENARKKVEGICKVIIRDTNWRTVNEISNINN